MLLPEVDLVVVVVRGQWNGMQMKTAACARQNITTTTTENHLAMAGEVMAAIEATTPSTTSLGRMKTALHKQQS